MRHETVGVTESLIESAENEFLQYGFRDASLQQVVSVPIPYIPDSVIRQGFFGQL